LNEATAFQLYNSKVGLSKDNGERPEALPLAWRIVTGVEGNSGSTSVSFFEHNKDTFGASISIDTEGLPSGNTGTTTNLRFRPVSGNLNRNGNFVGNSKFSAWTKSP